MKKSLAIIFSLFMICSPIMIMTEECYALPKFNVPKTMPKTGGYVKHAGGNKNQKSQLDYDRGTKHFSKTVRSGSSEQIPPDARNIKVNGLQVAPGSKITVSPQGATLFND